MRGRYLVFGLAVLGWLVGHPALGQGTPPAASAELAPGITFEVIDLRRQADKGVMELRFAVRNDSPADTSLKEQGIAYAGYLKDIAIIDFAGKKQYSIGSASDCLCSSFPQSDGGVVKSGERREFWAWYGLPPAGAKQVAIKLPAQPPIMNVALN